jgi:hypothetical protein
MNYPFFLFTQLYNEVIGIQYEYDILFGDIKNLYYEYLISDFNDDGLPEYECMVNFLKHNEKKVRKECSDRNLCLYRG